MKTSSPLPEPTDFSLVLGGPLFQLLRRGRLSGDTLELLHRRILVGVLVAWLPLLILSALNGQLLDGTTAMPFLHDVLVHVRFLVALPLLIVAELVVHQRIRSVVKQFLEREVIPESARVRFEAAIASTTRLRNSVLAEVLLIAFVYGVGVLIAWRQNAPLDTPSWFTVPAVAGSKLSLAGIWFGYVSLPFLQFLMLRWYFRVFIWTRFLWQVSRIELNLVPTHPDGVGGLGFLSQAADAFLPLAVAHGALLASLIADAIFHLGATLPKFKVEIVVVTVFVQGLVFGPLLVFSAQLARAKRRGLLEYGTLAARYVREFDAKWLRGGEMEQPGRCPASQRLPANESLLGSGDIQSLADMGNSFQVVRTMSVVPVTKQAVIQLAVATLVPVAPLLLTMMPLDELLKKLFGVLF